MNQQSSQVSSVAYGLYVKYGYQCKIKTYLLNASRTCLSSSDLWELFLLDRKKNSYSAALDLCLPSIV